MLLFAPIWSVENAYGRDDDEASGLIRLWNRVVDPAVIVPPSNKRKSEGRLLRPIQSTWNFAREWLSTREWRLFVPATFAMVVAAIVGGSFAARSMSPANRYAVLVADAQTAFANKDYPKATFLYSKALQSQPDSLSLQFHRAEAMYANGETEAAEQEFQKLAPTDGSSGYVEAHKWMLEKLKTQTELPATERGPALITHSRAIIRAEPQFVPARRLLALAALQSGRPKTAVEHFPYVVPFVPLARVNYARALKAVGQTEKAMDEATAAIEWFDQQKGTADESPLSFFIAWAAAHQVRDEYRQAVQVLDDGAKQAVAAKADPTPYRKAAAQIAMAWTNNLARTEPGSESQQLKLLARALRLSPNDKTLLTRIAELSKASLSETTAAGRALKQALADDKAPSSVHFTLGTQLLLNSGDPVKAKEHFEHAIRLDPKAFASLNNLAWTLAHSEENPDCETALQLVDQALEIRPNHPQIRDTKGQILIRMERWREAIAELELALRQLKGRPHIHKSLALAYEKIGEPSIAELHAKKVEELAGPTGADG